MKATAGVMALTIAMSGCSWLFQDRIRGTYDGRSEPQCSTSAGWQIVDGVFGGLSLLGALAAGGDDTITDSDRNRLIASGVLGALIHGASGITGGIWAGECKDAYAQWNGSAEGLSSKQENERARLALQLSDNPTNDPNKAAMYWCSSITRQCTASESACTGVCVEQPEVWCSFGSGGYLCARTRGTCIDLRGETRGPRGECVTQRAKLPYVPKTDNPVVLQPRGWYCTSSPTAVAAGGCARERADCERTRDATIAVVPDLTTCALTESAHCFADGRCAPTAEACGEQLSRAGAGVSGACEERK